MYPVSASPDGKHGSLVRTSLDSKFKHDGQVRHSRAARSTLSSNPLFVFADRDSSGTQDVPGLCPGPVAQVARAHP